MASGAEPYLSVPDVLGCPPWPALAAALMTCGLWGAGRQLARWLRGPHTDPVLGAAAGFLCAAGLLGAAAHALVLLGLSTVAWVRPLGLALAAYGLWQTPRAARALASLGRSLLAAWQSASATQRWALACSAVILVGLAACALGPVTDGDSFSYHLAAPLDWLAHGTSRPRSDWLHLRLAGLGEALNMVGLAAGTDALGACVQWAGLAIAAAAATRLVGLADRTFALLLLIGTPLVPQLVLTAKPMLAPASATLVALLLIWRRPPGTAIDRGTLVLALGVVCFAVACKPSFLLTGSLVALIVLAAAWRARRLGQAVAVLGLWAALLPAPVYARNAVQYGDPLSPLLERWKANPDPVVEAFADHLRDFGEAHSPRGVLAFGRDVLWPRGARINDVLGVGALAVALAVRWREVDRRLLGVAAVAGAVLLALTQLTPRFFVEPYWWGGLAVAAVGWGPLKRVVFLLLCLQATAVAAMVAWAVTAFFPGAWTARARENVLRDYGAQYSAVAWLDQALPPDAVIATELNNNAYLPRPAVSWDAARFLQLTDLSRGERGERLRRELSARHVTHLVVCDPPEQGDYGAVADCFGETVGTPFVLHDAVRNPWNRHPSVRLVVVRWSPDGGYGCCGGQEDQR